jgi:hypothetical protein
VKPEAVHQHPDGADEAGLVHIDQVRRDRHVVRAGSADLADHRIHLLVVLAL